jgi:hypothetical protein
MVTNSKLTYEVWSTLSTKLWARPHDQIQLQFPAFGALPVGSWIIGYDINILDHKEVIDLGSIFFHAYSS